MKRSGRILNRSGRNKRSVDFATPKPQTSFFSPVVQPKLSINQPNDSFEREADAMADKVMHMNATSPTTSHSTPGIQRKCAACEEEENIQRKEMSNTTDVLPSAAVTQTLQTGGEPMDQDTRSFMEDRFGTDFTNVRIHNDGRAHQSSKDIKALAYTHGNHISFNSGQYNPSTYSGKHLLAHELTHVMQQNSGAQMIQRKIEVDQPDVKIPNPGGKGLDQTNGQTVISYLNEICKDANPSISGRVISIDQSFCTGTGKDDKGNPVSKIDQSKTPAGCSCVCTMANSSNTFKIVINDAADPGTSADDLKLARTTGTGATITTLSPNGKVVETLSKSGNLEKAPSWLVFAHEFCGHASFIDKGKYLDDYVGQAVTGRGEHTPTVQIENKIRKEHNLEARGTHRDPCCGGDIDGIFQGSGATNCKDFLKTPKAQKMLQDPDTVLFECKKWRDEYNQLNGTSFTLEDTVTDKKDEISPAEYRYDVYFNKDMPQSWFDPSSSFAVSTTEQGKAFFEEASKLITIRGDIKKIQLEGYASSDKPKNDPDYNTRLVKRRVDLVKKELIKKGTVPGLFISFQPTIPGKTCNQIEAGSFNCSDTESKVATDPKDRKVVIRFTKF